MTFGSALKTYLDDDAVEYVRRYMHGTEAERYSGSWFDSYPSPPTEAAQLGGVANRIDVDDIIATTMLSIEVRLRSRSGFDPLKLLPLAENHAKVADLLQQLPTDTDLHELSGEQYQNLIGAVQGTRSATLDVAPRRGQDRVPTGDDLQAAGTETPPTPPAS